jgi:hypothetical protein
VHEKIRFDFAVRLCTLTILTLLSTRNRSHTPFVRAHTEEHEKTEAHTGKGNVEGNESFLTRIVAASTREESSVFNSRRVEAVKAVPTRVEKIGTAVE